MIDGLPWTFFFPLVVHVLAGVTTVVTGILTLTRPKQPGSHSRWGGCYLWSYTVVFLTAIILAVQHWPDDANLIVLGSLGYGAALLGYGARRYRLRYWVQRLVGRWGNVVHLSGMISSFVIFLTAFYFDKHLLAGLAYLLPPLHDLPSGVLLVGPTLLALPFLIQGVRQFAPKTQPENHPSKW